MEFSFFHSTAICLYAQDLIFFERNVDREISRMWYLRVCIEIRFASAAAAAASALRISVAMLACPFIFEQLTRADGFLARWCGVVEEASGCGGYIC